MTTAEHLPEMPCQELVEVVTAFLEGALPVRDRLRFEAHVAVCGPCRMYIEQLRQTLEAVGRIDADTLAPEVRAGLVEAFRGLQHG